MALGHRAISAGARGRLGEIVTSLAEHVEAHFAYVDVGSTGGAVTASARPTSVVHPAPASVRPQEFLWSITMWGPDLVTPELAERLDDLILHPEDMAKLDPFVRPHVRLEHRRLSHGGRFLQFRFLFGTELSGERAHLDSPFAEQLGLRSTNLQYRA